MHGSQLLQHFIAKVVTKASPQVGNAPADPTPRGKPNGAESLFQSRNDRALISLEFHTGAKWPRILMRVTGNVP